MRSLPDLSKWNTKNAKDMSCLFKKCKNILKIISFLAYIAIK